MALNVEKGTITAPAGTGNQTLSLASNFDPKAIILWTTGQTADARANANGRMSFGFGTYQGAAVQQNFETVFSLDNGTSSSGAHGNGDTSICKLYSAVTPTVALNVTLVSMSTGATSNVILNFATTLSGAIIHYLVLGGSDITSARAGNFTCSTTSPQDVTVAAGFGQPDLLLFHTNTFNHNTDGAGNARTGVGFAKSDTERWFAMFLDLTASNTMTCTGINRTDRALVIQNAGALDGEADLDTKVNWPTDGFRLLWPDTPATTPPVYYLALKGTFSSTIGNTTIPTAAAPQTQNLALASGTPEGALFCGWPGPAQASPTQDTTHADLGGFLVGAMDGTNEGCAGWTQDDGNASAATGVSHSTTKAYQGVTADATLANPPILNSECDSTISGANVVMTWGDTDTVARAYGYLLLGSGSAALTANIDDSTTLADARALDFGTTAADSLGPTDGVTAERGRAAVVGDSTTLTDGTAQEIGRSAAPADSVTTADAQALGFGPSAADSTALADARALGFGPSVVDSSAPADAQALGVGQSAADSTAAGDTAAPALGKAASAADSVTPTDGTTQATGKGVSPADSATPTDAVSRGFGPGIDDVLTPSDALVAAAGYVQAVNDATSLADALATAQGYGISQADATALSDAVAQSIGRAQTLADALTALDAVSFGVGRAVADAAAIADAQARGIGIGQAEVLVVVDSTASSITLALADILTVTDEVTAGQAAPYIHTLLPQDGIVTPAALDALVFLVVADGIVTVVDASGIVASFEASPSPVDAQTGGIVVPGTSGGSGDGYEGEGAQV